MIGWFRSWHVGSFKQKHRLVHSNQKDRILTSQETKSVTVFRSSGFNLPKTDWRWLWTQTIRSSETSHTTEGFQAVVSTQILAWNHLHAIKGESTWLWHFATQHLYLAELVSAAMAWRNPTQSLQMKRWSKEHSHVKHRSSDAFWDWTEDDTESEVCLFLITKLSVQNESLRSNIYSTGLNRGVMPIQTEVHVRPQILRQVDFECSVQKTNK